MQQAHELEEQEYLLVEKKENVNFHPEDILEMRRLIDAFSKERIDYQHEISVQNQRIEVLQQSLENLSQRIDKTEKEHRELKDIITIHDKALNDDTKSQVREAGDGFDVSKQMDNKTNSEFIVNGSETVGVGKMNSGSILNTCQAQNQALSDTNQKNKDSNERILDVNENDVRITLDNGQNDAIPYDRKLTSFMDKGDVIIRPVKRGFKIRNNNISN